jgi:two-component system, chemotaxis family, protein-glutamate methylesterase/glutaminase
VQLPEDAAFPDMPENAIKHVAVDYRLKLAEIGSTLTRLTREPIPEAGDVMTDRRLSIENRIALGASALEAGVTSLGPPSLFTCPDCQGAMVIIEDNSVYRFRCHTGHAFSQAALLSGELTQLERALWVALSKLEEREFLLERMSQEIAAEAESGESRRALARDLDKSQAFRKRLRRLLEDPLFTDSKAG